MPVTTNLMERMIVLRLNQGPGPMLDLLGAMAFKAVCTALELDIFEALSGGPLRPEELGRRINASERGTMLLLKALDAIGYVEKQDGRYTNTPMTIKWMLRNSPKRISGGFCHVENILEQWGYLSEAIRQGETPKLAWEWLDQHPTGWEDYNATMMATARMADDEIIAKVKLLPTARRLLDVGGGHGLHAINFCHRYPDLSATVLDWPQTREVAEANITAEGMGDRVSFREGDFWTDDLGSSYDVALLFNIIHMFLPEKNIQLLRKVSGALNPGAQVIILDQMALKISGPMAKAAAELSGLDLYVEVNGQTYAPDEVTGWLEKAGFTGARAIILRK
ncbi:MAG: methyltransferase domain-containing protein, partial [candidate division Zixibacteria bacterium]|nr:methyltransferase domain-containing protein [Gammaproteobacteria bacterium]NIX56392.1 methyltransferase domain-containing protein [candidate division Zixibacteria bacterium]